MKTSQAGTLESMDCLVTLEEAPSGAGVSIEITGASAARFKSAMEKKITETLAALEAKDLKVTVQDNGALDIVLGARVEAAYKRLKGAK
ncbi:citrate lyase acyl carrier protein [Cloacibacillus sp. An23]|uniref:citrate lyase acyl carrier protein n=2 Tax=Cloacibacillus sp. An23 TaxID=1965591 RepID=UPI000B3A737D|nr:citrate lyase acyl carrier protein [Cloacibacillus sp. An23]OUO93180.1 citrate lyase acyl carrier protein [Cloacibacillus sp. An23]